ncbi:MAG TPA: DUF5103 domain-containing protein [Bacteroidia bacterium]|nr:DUF5103 domain-containing protein [Bacteroidia bacterium]
MTFTWRGFLVFIPCFCALCFCSYKGLAQEGDDDYVNQGLRYDNFTYKTSIRTVQFHHQSSEYALPILELGSGEQLQLNFDDLDGDHKLYSISFVYCNADWSPSTLMISETMEGYYDININTFSYSMNTVQKYTYYSIVFPQNYLRFTKSGNYIVYVYEGGDKKNLVLSRRFLVYDNKASIDVSVRQPIAGDKQFSQQQIDFTVSGINYTLNNPYRDVYVVLQQNHRWDNAVMGVKPTFINGNSLEYSLNDACIFDGGNEFRYFDIRSTRFLTERVKEIYRDQSYKFHAVLINETNRRNMPYLFYNDIDGEYEIMNSETYGHPETEADYVDVHFFLPYPDPETKGNFYIMGRLSDWRMNRASKLTYNPQRFGYETVLNLKQGYYNYCYVFSSDDKKGGDQGLVEGNYWDTENTYDILVYHRQFGTYYDQLIGHRKFSSFKR